MCQCYYGALKALIFLVASVVYQILCFLAFVSLSIGISVVVSRLFEYIMSSAMPSSCEAFISLYLISVFAEFHIYCQHELNPLHRAYNFLPVATTIIYTCVYFVAFAEIYIQFEQTHATHAPSSSKRQSIPVQTFFGSSEDEAYESSFDSEQLHTALFLLALSYVLYCTMKIIQKDMMEQIKRLTNQTSCIHCVIGMGFLGVHFLMNLLYAIPLIIVAFSLKLYETNGSSTFIQLNMVAFLCGIVFAVTETKRPWPTTRMMPPFFYYENNSRAKALLGQLQILFILITFYRPFSSGKIPQTSFHAGNNHVLLFCFVLSYAVLHFTKTLVFIAIQKEFLPRAVEMGEAALVDEEVVIVDVDSEHDVVGDGGLGADEEGGVDGLCSRCRHYSNNSNNNNDSSVAEKKEEDLVEKKSSLSNKTKTGKRTRESVELLLNPENQMLETVKSEDIQNIEGEEFRGSHQMKFMRYSLPTILRESVRDKVEEEMPENMREKNGNMELGRDQNENEDRENNGGIGHENCSIQKEDKEMVNGNNSS